jgi:Ca-activated chloride channel family protein
VLALLPIAALAFRRGYLAACLLGLMLHAPTPALALDWGRLWRTPDQAAQEAFQQGDYRQAAEAFEDPAWKAAAAYKAKDYEAAAKSLSGLTTGDSDYNRGNALARLGRYREAIEAYDKALRADPNNEDARANKELVEKALRRQQPEQEAQRPEKGSDKAGKAPPQSAQASQNPPQQDEAKDGQAPETGPTEPTPNAARAQSESDRPPTGSSGEDPAQQTAKSEHGQSLPGNAESKAEPKPAAAIEEMASEEAQRASEQWLRRIPDDPGGLLKRKFYYQYQQRHRQRQLRGEPEW